MPLRVAELETLFTANTADVEKGEKLVKAVGDRIEKKPITQKVGSETKEALAGLDKVDTAAKRLVSRETAVTVNANITRAEKQADRLQQRLDYLKSVETTMDVTADVRRAEASLQRVTRSLDGLRSARAEMVVEVEDGKARKTLTDVADFAEQQGKDGGSRSGSAFIRSMDGATRGAGERIGSTIGGGVGESLEQALVAIPVAGGIILAGVAIGKAILGSIRDGMQQEVQVDRLEALTGITAADAARVGRGAGEAYANVFGESIEANMDTARLALQFDLLDADASATQAQRVIENLSGIAGVLGEEVRPVAEAVTVLLRTGVARSADEAFDLIAAGSREGLNRSEDLLDTLIEYPALFRRLGLTGPQALGLISQGLANGARNTDLAADALKEFQIRSTDASEASAEGYRLLGLDAREMTAQIARGGEDAARGLDTVLDKLRETEDPVVRNAAAVALFGTQAEDLGEALFAMDLSTAVEQIDGVEGAARRMFDTLADNDATKIEQAQRNIEVAATGIQGALAAAFSEPLGYAADWVSENRGPLTQFLLDLANGAIDLGRSIVNSMADGTESVGVFVAGPLREMAVGLRDLIEWLPGDADTSGLDSLIDSMAGFDDQTATAAQTMRDQLLPGLDEAQDRLNEWGEPVVAMGYLNDASLRLADSVNQVGLAHDGATQLVDAFTVAQDGSVRAGSELDAQVRSAADALWAEIEAAHAAGEGQEQLRERFDLATEGLVDQLTQLGLTDEQARALIETYGAVPDWIETVVTASTNEAARAVGGFIERYDGSRIRVRVEAGTPIYSNPTGEGMSWQAQGSVMEFMAHGGIRGLTPMAPVAQMVPANTWRVVGDRSDVAEAYIPLDGSARSMAILAETIRRMGGMPMAEGGVVAQSAAPPVVLGDFVERLAALLEARMRETGRGAVSASRDYTDEMSFEEAVVRR